jgi:hypothetical protein
VFTKVWLSTMLPAIEVTASSSKRSERSWSSQLEEETTIVQLTHFFDYTHTFRYHSYAGTVV